MDRAYLNQKSNEDGYMLLEVLIATAVASSILFLLLSALMGLGNSQERIGETTRALAEDVFSNELLSNIFLNVRPDYHDDEVKFSGKENRLSAKTYFDVEDGAGDLFSLTLQESEDGQFVDLMLQIEEDVFVISSYQGGGYEFRYRDHFGNLREEWKANKEEGMVDQSIAKRAPHVHMLPVQILLINTSNEETILFSYDLPFSSVPPLRQQDEILFLESLL